MYAKIFTQIYDGTLVTRGPWEALVTFQQMLVLADLDGNVDMTSGAIARRTTIPLEIIEKGILCLLGPDAESRTPSENGRRIVPLCDDRSWGWRIVNYKHYRDMKREEDRREYHREYWHKRKLKLNDSTETQHAQPSQPIAEADTSKDKVEKSTARSRGTRLPPDFVPDMEFAKQYYCGKVEFDKFRDYWDSIPGAKGVKLNWNATWRNWCRNARPSPAAQAAVTVDSKAVDATAAYLASQQMTPEQKAAADAARRLAMSRRVA